MRNIIANCFCSVRITPGKRRIILLVILITVLGLRLSTWTTVLSADSARFLDPDSPHYDNLARALLHTSTFTVSVKTPELIETQRTPGYPLFLAGVYAIFGEQYAIAILMQILLGLVIIALVYAMARHLWGSNVALLAALLFGLDIASFSFSLLLLSESFFTLLITAMLVVGIRLLESASKPKWAVVLGMLLALATFVRPISYYLVVPLVLGFLGIGKIQQWRWQTLLAVSALILLSFALLVGGWQVRNYLLTGSAQFSSIEGFNMLYHRGAPIVALREGISLKDARSRLGLEKGYGELDLKNGWSVAMDERWKREGLALIHQHPVLFIRTQIPGIVRLMVAPGEGELLRALGIPIGSTKSLSDYFKRFNYPSALLAALVALLYLVVVYIGVLYWLWRSLMDRQIVIVDVFLWGVLFYFIIISAGQAESRFRVPIMPILTLYAAQGLSQFCNKLLRGDTGGKQ